MTRRKSVGKIRSNETAHRRAITDPTVASALRDLRVHWKSLDPIERGDRLRNLSALDCSTRGLGEELGQSSTTVRRHIDIAKLPAAQREAVRNGESAKKMLGRMALAKRVHRSQERVRADDKTGALSDEMADMILDFCRTTKGVPKTPLVKSEVPQFIECVTRAVNGHQHSVRCSLRYSKQLTTAELFRRTRPAQEEGEFWMEYRARWLAIVICSKTPESPIWQRALKKFANRSAELEPKKTPRQMYKDKLARLKWISDVPGAAQVPKPLTVVRIGMGFQLFLEAVRAFWHYKWPLREAVVKTRHL